MEVRIQNLTRDGLTTILSTVEVVVIPVGSIEDHGRHLPAGQDAASVSYIAEAAARRLYPRVLVAPTVELGLSPHYMQWLGTITIKGETFVSLLLDICVSLSEHGVKRVLFLNGHGSNYNPNHLHGGQTGPMDLVVLKVRELGLRVTSANYWDLLPPWFFEETLEFERGSGHGGEFETSIGLYIHPDKVTSERLVRAEGVSVGVEAGTTEKGRHIIEEVVKATVTYVEEFIEGKVDESRYRPYA